MVNKIVWFVFLLCFIKCEAVKDYNKLNLVQINMSSIAYKRLMVTKDNLLSATPLALLDHDKLKKFNCYKNIRSNLWSLGVPVIFWNDEYMKKIASSIDQRNQLKNYTNKQTTVLPPSDIIAYRITWRRGYIEGLDSNQISLDSSWQDSQTDFVLPMTHSFVIEFNAGNESKQMCADVKTKLLNETLQSFEMVVEFQKTLTRKRKIPDISITINHMKSVKMYNESNCNEKREDKCFVSKEFAEKWAYDVSTRMMENVEIIHLNLQKDIFDGILDYLCKNKISIFEIELKTVARLSKGIDNEMACKIPNNMYVKKVKPCSPRYDRYGYERTCAKEYFDYGNDVVIKLDPFQIYDEKNQFYIPILKL